MNSEENRKRMEVGRRLPAGRQGSWKKIPAGSRYPSCHFEGTEKSVTTEAACNGFLSRCIGIGMTAVRSPKPAATSCHFDAGEIRLLHTEHPITLLLGRPALLLCAKLASCTTGLHKYSTGRVMSPTGLHKYTTGRVVLPTGLHKYTTGRVILPTGKGTIPTGRVTLPAGKGEVPAGRVNILQGRTGAEDGSRESEVGSWKSEVGSWKSEVGSRESEVRSPQPATTSCHFEETEKSVTTEAACNRFLIAFGMTATRSTQPATTSCHFEETEKSVTTEAACNRFLIAFGMTATRSSQLEASGLIKRNSTVYHSNKTISFPKSVPSTANEQGSEFCTLRFSPPPLGGRGAEERAIRACEILRFFNN